MTPKPSVLVAMSGGVDSSVSAALLHEQGYEVLGSHLKLVHLDGVDHGCCGPRAESDARAVAEVVGFDFEIVDMSEEFGRTVLDDFFTEHRAGRTPNPCARCNEHIKFGAFLARADALGFDFVATGHYVST
ncbi:MAG TPA: tRNA 2-thiouridine(34) synthase MnmA, partial [Actinomycetota bacterium]